MSVHFTAIRPESVSLTLCGLDARPDQITTNESAVTCWECESIL